MKKMDGVIPMEDRMVNPKKKIKLTNLRCGVDVTWDAQTMERQLKIVQKQLEEKQGKLYADGRFSVLIIFQAMDAGGKDGAIKHVLSGFNPLGVRVFSFKEPSLEERRHDYFWRHALALPARGEIAIHNRSHYENVLITKVHPELILKENIPGIDSIKKIDDQFWKKRYKQIRRFEKNCTENGMVIFKFFLHLSKDEQKKRFLERIDNPSKNWKFSLTDLRERQYWDAYQRAYEQAINATASQAEPWFIIPADDKAYARLAIATIISKQFDNLNLRYPKENHKQKQELQKAKFQLMNEHKTKTK